MNDAGAFTLPEVTDADIRWASGLLGLEPNAFYGEDGTDPRQEVLKCMESLDVAACPGSGKTTLLVAKLAILAARWPYRTHGICVLSHTNAARDEVESKLGCSAVGRQLLSYPHFVGTIHSFVNEFLAIPWLRTLGYPIKVIDTAVCENRRWWMLPQGTRKYLEHKHVTKSDVCILDTDFSLGKKNGRFPCAEHTDTYQLMITACRTAAREGYHCYDDMFLWAGELMDRHPGVVDMIRSRFPLLCIDEAQDNSEGQSTMLHRIFTDGAGEVIRQRFGDENQAIYGYTEDNEAITQTFPSPTVETAGLPNSHRFGQTIADLADPLGLVPYDLKGHGPKELLSSGKPHGRHTIFLFDDGSLQKVMDAYGELLVQTFSKEELREGVFTAVGQVHSQNGDDHKPRHIGHYWADYDPELTKSEPKPQTFVQYVSAGLGKSEVIGDTYPAVEKIAEGILRLADMIAARTNRPLARRSHRYLLRLLEGHPAVREKYQSLVVEFAAHRTLLTREKWNADWMNVVVSIAETIAGTSGISVEASGFLQWREVTKDPLSPSISAERRDNLYRYDKDGKQVAIRVGSIHSVKGETHTATLVLESFWKASNLDKLNPWLLGPKKGWDEKKDGIDQKKRLKIHYVAMTRPTHLLCLAMKRSSFVDANGDLDQEKVKKLEDLGWHVEPI